MKVLFDETTIQKRVTELARDIEACYEGKPFTLLVILKGAFVFAADLFRRIRSPLVRVEFLRLASYRGTVSSGTVILPPPEELARFADRDVLIVEDIVDTGLTLSALVDALRGTGASSVRVCAFLEKTDVNQGRVSIDFLGFPVPNHFIVGYGLDCDEKHRNLPYLALYEET